jgi:hypothetical protein
MRQALESIVGAEVLASALATLSPDLRAEYETITLLSWVRLSTSSQVVDAAAERSGWNPERLYDAAVRRGVEQSFRTFWKVLLHFTNDEALFARAPVLYAKTRNVGVLAMHALGPGHAEARIVGWPQMNERAIRAVGIGLRVTLEAAGRRDVRGTWTRRSDGAAYQFRWRTPVREAGLGVVRRDEAERFNQRPV